MRSLEANPQRTPEEYNKRYDELKKYLELTEREHLDVDWAGPRRRARGRSAPRSPPRRTRPSRS